MKRRYITPQVKSITCDITPLLAGSEEQEKRRIRFDDDAYADPEDEVL
ncbi:MAG: hypothetical protein KBT34_14665 [Prevotella sp.]|nr:hypothetical protein [Candidatus Prevotella equi]